MASRREAFRSSHPFLILKRLTTKIKRASHRDEIYIQIWLRTYVIDIDYSFVGLHDMRYAIDRGTLGARSMKPELLKLLTFPDDVDRQHVCEKIIE